MGWYIGHEGASRGPFEEARIREMIAAGELGPSDLVWRPGASGWMEAGQVEGLFRPPPLEEGAAAPAPEQAAEASPWQAVGGPAEPSAPAAAEPRRNYLRRHWDGDLSLGISYWVNGVLVTLPLVLIGVAMGQADWTTKPRGMALLAILWAVLVVVATLWQLVGIWRSSENHVARGGKPVWSGLAKAMVVLGFLRFGLDVSQTTLPQISGLVDIVAGDPAMAGHQLRVLNDGAELEFSGPIGFGVTEEVEKLLDAHPTIGVVHLNSNGGRVEEAKKLAELIEARGLTTYTSTECASACTLAFLGGARRVLGEGARLGFHGFDFPGSTSLNRTQWAQEGANWMMSRGVQGAFAMQAMEEGHTSMWYPERAELLASGVVTEEAGFGEMGFSGVSAEDLKNLEEHLLKVELFAALKEIEPAIYERVSASMMEGMRRGRPMSEIRAAILPEVSALYMQRTPYASDEAVIGLTELLVAQMEDLMGKDPRWCYQMMSEDAQLSGEAGSHVRQDLRERELVVGAAVLRSAATGRYGPRPDEAFERQIEEVVGQLMATWGSDAAVLADLGDPSVDAATACGVTLDMYRLILAKPKAEAGQMLRTLYGS